MRVTLRDVAKQAGVSVMSVSSVLNGAGTNVSVSPETADKIRKAAEGLNYRPNKLAQALRSRRTGMVALVFQHFGGINRDTPYQISVLSGVFSALLPRDYALTICPKVNQQGGLDAVSDGRFDGVIWCRPELDGSEAGNLFDPGIPLVILNSPASTLPGISTFCVDNMQAMNLVVGHLKELGHKNISFVIDKTSYASFEGQERSTAFIDAMQKAGLPEPGLTIVTNDLKFTSGEYLEAYRSTQRPHTALVCFSDQLAATILKEFEAMGVSVPSDVSVIGFDSSPFCDETHPPLTSVNQPVEQIARDATQYLLRQIDAYVDHLPPCPVATSVHRCTLDIRESTAPPKE